MDRCYVNFVLDKVFVYPRKMLIGKPQIWTTEKAKQYLLHLEDDLSNDTVVQELNNLFNS